MLPHAPHARQVVLELRELDLELSLGRHRVLGEDVEDQLRAVDDARVERVLERPLLRRVELVVDEQHLGARLLVLALQLFELALSDVRPTVGPAAVLDELADRLDARGPGELAGARRASSARPRRAGSTATAKPRSASAPGSGIWLSRASRAGLCPGPCRIPAWPTTSPRGRSSSSTCPPRAGTRRRWPSWFAPRCRSSWSTTTISTLLFRRADRRAARSSSSRGTSTPSRRTRTCPGGSRTARCTGSARAT